MIHRCAEQVFHLDGFKKFLWLWTNKWINKRAISCRWPSGWLMNARRLTGQLLYRSWYSVKVWHRIVVFDVHVSFYSLKNARNSLASTFSTHSRSFWVSIDTSTMESHVEIWKLWVSILGSVMLIEPYLWQRIALCKHSGKPYLRFPR